MGFVGGRVGEGRGGGHGALALPSVCTRSPSPQLGLAISLPCFHSWGIFEFFPQRMSVADLFSYSFPLS